MAGSSKLELRAGPAALRHLERDGLAPDDVRLIPGAAGGAKWLVLKELDRFLFEQWLPQRRAGLDLVGASIGAWRFAAGMLGRTEHFYELYLGQRYSPRPDRREVTETARAIMTDLLGADGASGVVAHPRMRLAIMTARSHGPAKSERAGVLGGVLAATALANLIRPQWQQFAFRRHLFADPRISNGGAAPAWARRAGWSLESSPLSAANLGPALMASGSIPLVLEAVRDIPDAPPGIYRDGGITDYHLPLDFARADGIVLYPHFSASFKAGWFDKHLNWRRLPAPAFANALLVYPSAAFIASLPYAKIPDRHDFTRLPDAERLTYWRRVVAESRRLVDEFEDWLARGCPRDRVLPLEP